MLTPSDEGRAILTVTDIAFAACEGKNVMCVSEDVDLKRSHATTFSKSGNLTTFMQTDVVTVDLGYVTNAGTTVKQKQHDPDADDQFGVKVQVQMSDSVHTFHDNYFYMHFGVKFGDDLIVVGNYSN